eukprot:TRINITY_DN4364_c0_g1_i1.p1 TRINITY_DN4364_c0_g1~~TRINITY_DN4364_c0_g1_i1.p1  ORF type:complete len:880 (-),score=376.47 TRINITY_DN4364_c0_g1_i1:260-2899(-)
MDFATKGELRTTCNAVVTAVLDVIEHASAIKACEDDVLTGNAGAARAVSECCADVAVVVECAVGEDRRMLMDANARLVSAMDELYNGMESEEARAEFAALVKEVHSHSMHFQSTRGPAHKKAFQAAVEELERRLRLHAKVEMERRDSCDSADHTCSPVPDTGEDVSESIDESVGGVDESVLEEATSIVEVIRKQFPVFKLEWDRRAEGDRASVLTAVAEILTARQSAPASIARQKESLEDLIRQRGRGDLARLVHLLPQIVGAGVNAATVENILVRVAEATMELIVVSNTLVLQTSIAPDELKRAVANLFMVIVDAVRSAPTASAQDDSEKIRESLAQVAEELLEMKGDEEKLFREDEFILRAAGKGEGKLIEVTLKNQLWERCNALRISILYLFCTLRGIWDQNAACRSVLYQLLPTALKVGEASCELASTVMTTRAVMEMAEGDVATTTGGAVADGAASKPIWDEYCGAQEEQLAETAVQCETGTLNLLVIALTSDKNYDTNFISTFITTYRSFTTPSELFAKLLERFEVPEQKLANPSRSTAIQWRVAVVIKHWVETQFYDFDDDLIKELFRFVDKTLFNAGHTAMAQALHEKLQTKVEEREKRLAAMISVPPTDLMMPRDVLNPAQFFMSITDEEVARQLTLIDFEMYASIQVQELLKTAWSSEKLRHRSPHVFNLLGRLNRIAFFVPSLVLWQDTKAGRAQMVEKFIRVAKLLRDLSNFHTMMGVVTGLNISAITRLKFTMGEVDSKLLAHFKRLESTMDPSSSFKNYRKAVRAAMMPALPYLGVYLTDLTFIEDGNPDTLDVGGVEQINFGKRKMIFKVIQEVLLYQQRPYSFPSVDPIRTFLLSFPHGTDKSLYNISLQYEPRSATSAKEIR